MATQALIGQSSRKRIAPFRLHRPTTVEAALSAMTSAGGNAVYMAGGLELLNRMKGGLVVSDVIHLRRMAELSDISTTDDQITIGAGVTHQELADDPVVKVRIPALAQCSSTIGSVRVRRQGTVGGNVMARDPTFDLGPILTALGATLVMATPDGLVRVPHADVGPGGGLLVSIEIPIARLSHLVVDRSLKPMLSVAVAVEVQNGRCSLIRVGVGGASAKTGISSIDVSPAQSARELADSPDFAQVFASLTDPSSDWQATGGYRRQMVAVLVRRALARIADEDHD
jgi:carbon-monoxide dehydrogenase medium subunit